MKEGALLRNHVMNAKETAITIMTVLEIWNAIAVQETTEPPSLDVKELVHPGGTTGRDFFLVVLLESYFQVLIG